LYLIQTPLKPTFRCMLSPQISITLTFPKRSPGSGGSVSISSVPLSNHRACPYEGSVETTARTVSAYPPVSGAMSACVGGYVRSHSIHIHTYQIDGRINTCYLQVEPVGWKGIAFRVEVYGRYTGDPQYILASRREARPYILHVRGRKRMTTLLNVYLRLRLIKGVGAHVLPR